MSSELERKLNSKHAVTVISLTRHASLATLKTPHYLIIEINETILSALRSKLAARQASYWHLILQHALACHHRNWLDKLYREVRPRRIRNSL